MFTDVTFLETMKNNSLSKGRSRGVTHAKKSRPGLEKSNHQIKLDSLYLYYTTPQNKSIIVFQMEDNEVNLNFT